MFIVLRIQVYDPADDDEVAMVQGLQDRFSIDTSSDDPLPEFDWDEPSLEALRIDYNAEFAMFEKYPSDWAGKRGELDEEARHLAVAGAWGLFPETEATYINFNEPGLRADICYEGTFSVPENDAFWSITMYGEDGKMFSENCILNDNNTEYNQDGTFTVRFGPASACGTRPNRLDTAPGWNFLLRVYRPGSSVRDNTYRLPELTPVE